MRLAAAKDPLGRGASSHTRHRWMLGFIGGFGARGSFAPANVNDSAWAFFYYARGTIAIKTYFKHATANSSSYGIYMCSKRPSSQRSSTALTIRQGRSGRGERVVPIHTPLHRVSVLIPQSYRPSPRMSQDTYWCHTVSVFTASPFSPNRIGECDTYCRIYCRIYCSANCTTN